jgi:uncharacterized protein (TIGR00369 family)
VSIGIDAVRAVQRGDVPGPGIARLLGFTLTRVEAGAVDAVLETSDEMTNPMHTVHGGIAATLLDSAMGCAVHTTLGAGERYTTIELKVNFVRAITEATGRVVAEGSVIHRGGRVTTAEARLTDEDGRLLAHGTSTCLILDAGPGGRASIR